MDSSFHKPFFQLFFLSLAILSCYFSSADLIGDVCSGTKNPSFCSTSLRSDPRSGNADLKLLGKISIKLSTDSVSQTEKILLPKLRSSVNGGNTKILLGIYDTCLETYGEGVDSLNDSFSDLNKSDYEGMSNAASAADTDVETCDDSFSEADINPPQELVAASKIASDLISIVLAVAARLKG